MKININILSVEIIVPNIEILSFQLSHVNFYFCFDYINFNCLFLNTDILHAELFQMNFHRVSEWIFI